MVWGIGVGVGRWGREDVGYGDGGEWAEVKVDGVEWG